MVGHQYEKWVPVPSSVCPGSLLWFDHLTSSHGLLGVLTLGWRFKHETRSDPWSHRFDQFKFGSRDSIVNSAFAVCRVALGQWYWPDHTVAFTAALSAKGGGLDPRSRVALLGRKLAIDSGREWHGDILRKDPHHALHDHRQLARDRTRTVRGTYRCVRDIDCHWLIVCDDFVTTGDTLTEIARAIHERNSQVSILGLVLAKTESRSFAMSQRQYLTNDHLPDAWARLWDDFV